MREHNSQQGFSALYVTLAVGLVCAIGIAGYLAWQNQHRSEVKLSVSSTPMQTPTPTPIPLYIPPASADWKTYTSTYEQASFEYPSSWALEQDPSLPDDVTLTGPNGLKLSFTDRVSGLGGVACHPQVVLTTVEPLADAGASASDAVYLVQSPAVLALADRASWAGSPVNQNVGFCPFYPLITSKLHQEVDHSFEDFSFGSSFEVASASHPIPTDEQADLATAKQILESFHY